MDRNPQLRADQNIPEKRRRTQAKQNKDAPRYECFCARQYLSYPALYLHLKNKHINYFISNRGTKKVEATKLIESYDYTKGYKIFKLPSENINNMGQLDHEKKDGMTAKQPSINQYPQNPIFYPNYMPYFPYRFDYLNSHPRPAQKSINPQTVNIELAFSLFTESLSKLHPKQKQETQLFLALLIDCLNQHYEVLKDERTRGKEVKRYTAEYNCNYLFRITNHFQEVYLAEIRDKQKQTYAFYLTHAYLITSQAYKKVLKDLFDFLYNLEPQDKSMSQEPAAQPFGGNDQNQVESMSNRVHHKQM